MQQDIIIKFCVVGQPGVGKTSMLYQYVHKKFDEKVRPTIGCDFSTKLKNNIDGKPIRLQLWDIAGQQRFNAVSKMYLRGALGCVVVCSATEKNTIDETLKWKKIIQQNSDFSSDSVSIPCMLVMNKSDLIDTNSPQQYQTKQYMQNFANTHNFSSFIFSSAKQNTNIEEIFQKLLNETMSRGLVKSSSSSVIRPSNQNKNSTIKLTNIEPTSNKKQKKKCCG